MSCTKETKIIIFSAVPLFLMIQVIRSPKCRNTPFLCNGRARPSLMRNLPFSGEHRRGVISQSGCCLSPAGNSLGSSSSGLVSPLSLFRRYYIFYYSEVCLSSVFAKIRWRSQANDRSSALRQNAPAALHPRNRPPPDSDRICLFSFLSSAPTT